MAITVASALDDLLKRDFALPKGLADTSKVKIKVDSQEINPRTKKPRVEEREVHKVQILDPATGTGTFLAEVVKRINSRLAPFEQIRRFRILDREFSIDRGEVTPTMKVRRKQVIENYKHLLNELYLGKEEFS